MSSKRGPTQKKKKVLTTQYMFHVKTRTGLAPDLKPLADQIILMQIKVLQLKGQIYFECYY